MDPLELALFLVFLAATCGFVGRPIRSARRPLAASGEIAALEAERDARLDAIRDAELDLQTGKLSADDHRVLDARLREEALAALRRLDVARSDEEVAR
jgi:hypothetical protein